MTAAIHTFFMLMLQLTVLFFAFSFLLHLLQVFIPYEALERRLRRAPAFAGGLLALFLAFITPFCSCSTIPLVVQLLQKNIRFGVVMVFLFASPLLDPTIFSVMAVFLGWETAVLYMIITAAFSLGMGLLLEALGMERTVKQVVMSGYHSEKKTFSWRRAWEETWVLMKTVFPYLTLGAAVGAVIHGLVPASFISTHLGGDAWWLIPAAAVIGLPLYIRVSSMIPISQMFIAGGMAAGPVMAMLISSAGASLPELVLMKTIFKSEMIAVFVLSVLTMSTVSGFLFYLF
ncbi:permease [Alkalicoccus urumqiensis]|uniref:Permease n=1 Tax=Alkalicoccus urumqiensis TaxID=1548213 RepID=A0A2P6MJP9_ALKUR|nr:permease [Alkalicoccus urumqiensis]PRO66512.1 permease [Alkalicoccus urumqiensis]